MSQDDPELAAYNAERLRVASLYRAIFEDDRRGQAVIADLLRQFKVGPAKGFTQEAVLQTFVRSHQREIFEYIDAMVTLGGQVMDEPPTTERQSDDDLP